MAVVEDLAFVVHVVEKQVEGRDALQLALFNVLPFRAGDDARHEIVREYAFLAVAVPVYVEGDSLVHEREVDRLLSPRHLIRR